ncbi:MAG: GTP-binding protein [Thermoprotei archaeon]
MSTRRYPPEDESGNIEYKLTLSESYEDKLEKLSTQIKYRVNEGGGEALFVLGVSDDGEVVGLSEEEYRRSFELLKKAAEKVNVKIGELRTEKVNHGIVAQILLRRTREGDYPICLTIPVLGNADSGKSTTIGVLVTGELDDGNGKAMKMVARYLHEIKMRRTSSIAHRLLGFDVDGKPVNYEFNSPLNEAEVYLKSFKIISFVDLAGHEKYLRTTLKGVMGHEADYSMIVIAANSGLVGTTKEHFGLAVALKIPIFIVVTKTDIAPREILEETLESIKRLIKMPSVDKIPLIIKGMDDVIVAAVNMPSGRIIPIFLISNTTGDGLVLLRNFLNLLPPRVRWNEQLNEPFKMYIDEKFNVTGVGTVVSGLIIGGSVKNGDELQLGPMSNGSYKIVKVRSIQVNRVPVSSAIAGQDVTLALSGVEYDEIDKGMVLLSTNMKIRPIWKFEAKVTILHHPTMIRYGYQAVLHLHSIRQSVIFEWLSKSPLRTGDTATVRLRFMYRPVYLTVGDKFVFREGRTRGLGYVTKIL